jgi:hypothetical protein
MRALLEEQGFRIVDWADRTEAGLAWFAELQKARAQTSGTPPAPGLHVAMGSDFPGMTANLFLRELPGIAGQRPTRRKV